MALIEKIKEIENDRECETKNNTLKNIYEKCPRKHFHIMNSYSTKKFHGIFFREHISILYWIIFEKIFEL